MTGRETAPCESCRDRADASVGCSCGRVPEVGWTTCRAYVVIADGGLSYCDRPRGHVRGEHRTVYEWDDDAAEGGVAT